MKNSLENEFAKSLEHPVAKINKYGGTTIKLLKRNNPAKDYYSPGGLSDHINRRENQDFSTAFTLVNIQTPPGGKNHQWSPRADMV